jgi:hypothetical protein
MQQLLFWGLGLWVLTRLNKRKPQGMPTPQQGVNVSPQAARVRTANAVLEGKLPCIDPAGPGRLAAIKDLERDLKTIQSLLDDESQRSQPDEEYIKQLSSDADLLMQKITDQANRHADLCKKYFEDYARRTSTPATGQAITTTDQTRF